MLPEQGTGSLGKQWHSPFWCYVRGLAKVNKKETEILELDLSYYIRSMRHPGQKRKPVRGWGSNSGWRRNLACISFEFIMNAVGIGKD